MLASQISMLAPALLYLAQKHALGVALGACLCLQNGGDVGVYSATPTRLFTPHFFGNFADKFQLAPLLVFGEHVAFFGGGEAALGAEAKLVNINVLGGFLDAVDDVLFVFQFACFAGY